MIISFNAIEIENVYIAIIRFYIYINKGNKKEAHTGLSYTVLNSNLQFELCPSPDRECEEY